MLHPEDHAAYLAEHDFVTPPGDFTPIEKELLTKYGRWMEALASGAIAPATPGQEQFVRVARGEGEPGTDFERAWTKVLKERAVAEEVARSFQAMREARAHASEVEAEYLAARQVVLAAVREQLDAVDATFAEQLQSANEGASAAEKAVRELVLKVGRSVNTAGIKAVYSSPRVTWDNTKLAAYAEAHPEVKEFRKVGKPSVSLRFGDGAGTEVSESGEVKAESGVS
ncbi:MAG: DUF413 domain-containing protein [Planctomycetes bacterium]|nr:DUF413 domain-containing protein [Planctomycetota bacterium]